MFSIFRLPQGAVMSAAAAPPYARAGRSPKKTHRKVGMVCDSLQVAV